MGEGVLCMLKCYCMIMCAGMIGHVLNFPVLIQCDHMCAAVRVDLELELRLFQKVVVL